MMLRVFAVGVVATILALPTRAGGIDDFNHGIEAHNRGDDQTAIASFTRALTSSDLTASDRSAALIDRGAAYERQKQYANAIADFTAALALNPGRYDATYGRMLAYRENDQGQLAASDCDALVKMRPNIAALQEACGIVGWENGDFPTAVAHFETAIGLGAKPPVFAVLWLEIARLRAGKPNEAEFVNLTRKLDLDGWPAPIFDLYMGKASPDAVVAAAEKIERHTTIPAFLHLQDSAPLSPSESASLQLRRCQAAFFVGEWQLLGRNTAKAQILLRDADADCKDWLPPKKELARLAQK
jgi:tetratricopeptide (TPR) repeat protein